MRVESEKKENFVKINKFCPIVTEQSGKIEKIKSIRNTISIIGILVNSSFQMGKHNFSSTFLYSVKCMEIVN